MAKIKPFRAVRPTRQLADKVAALPYDVMNSEEARAMTEGNPYSFLHVDKAEIDLPPETGLYDEIVYLTARDNLQRMIRDGVFLREIKPCMYLYRQEMNGRIQTGVVACASIDDYLNNVIKKHELTRAEKEEDRCKHVDICDAQTGPIFLTYHVREAINALAARVMRELPLYDFVADGVRQVVWIIDREQDIQSLMREFDAAGNLYIADGHHRTASAVRVGQKRRAENPDYSGDEEFNYFLCVLFPDEQLYIMDYNRVVKDLNGLSGQDFLAKLTDQFTVEPYGGEGPCRPATKHSFGMYLDGKWYLLTARPGSFDAEDPVARLDVSILQQNLLAPILAIGDPRTDKRIDFVGGIRGLAELERRVDIGGMRVAFAMHPTSIDDLISIADSGRIMPPKSTWFEPKLLSGLFIHELS